MRGASYKGYILPTLIHAADAANAMRYVMDGYDGEPLFVVRGRDLLARDILAVYAGAASHVPGMERQVQQHRDRFAQFADENLQLMKFPDPFPGWPDANVR